ncbi:hypothetical protein RRG08_046790 [Elysia crispata]|uniref:Uncharacterized protein n=1 Tax=Elysia crispata TaxID=231223 RepID=A0AAE0ZUV9_9GAST|nr:hypothetical protein RRG08_046790 [Elysia crispata]
MIWNAVGKDRCKEFDIGVMMPKNDRCDRSELRKINPKMEGKQKELLDLHVENSIHFVIERPLRHQEIFSPLGLFRKLTTSRNTKVIQITTFFDYQT